MFLNGRCFVSNYTAVIQITDDREIKKSLCSLYVGNIGHPLLIRSVSMEISVEQIIVSVQSLTVIAVSSSPDNRKKTVLVHNTQNSLRVMVNTSAH